MNERKLLEEVTSAASDGQVSAEAVAWRVKLCNATQADGWVKPTEAGALRRLGRELADAATHYLNTQDPDGVGCSCTEDESCVVCELVAAVDAVRLGPLDLPDGPAGTVGAATVGLSVGHDGLECVNDPCSGCPRCMTIEEYRARAGRPRCTAPPSPWHHSRRARPPCDCPSSDAATCASEVNGQFSDAHTTGPCLCSCHAVRLGASHD